jgi:geranylgeranyl diphosphate synthase type II
MGIQEKIFKDYQSFELQQRYLKDPQTLYEPINYVLALGGKKVRPVLTCLAHEAGGGTSSNILKMAYALELFHNFTLLHDDVMDHAEQRRGKPTVHKKWDVATAILSGDEMLIQTCILINEVEQESGHAFMSEFLTMASEVCQGQQSDMDFENRDNVTLDEYMEMIRKKTAILLAVAIKFGSRLAGIDGDTQEVLYDYGTSAGVGFQMMDDYLDTYGDSSFGKRIGGDILEDKKTWLYIKAMELANAGQKAVLANWHGTSTNEEAKIDAVRSIYTDLGVDKLIAKEMEKQFEHADQLMLSMKNQMPNIGVLSDYLNRLAKRTI